jgi:hypothetical protein
MRTHIYILVAILMLLVADIVLASDWRGIIPLHSTRADVEKKQANPLQERIMITSKWKAIVSLLGTRPSVVREILPVTGMCR